MFTVAALYHFTRFDDPAGMRDLCNKNAMSWELLVSPSGERRH